MLGCKPVVRKRESKKTTERRVENRAFDVGIARLETKCAGNRSKIEKCTARSKLLEWQNRVNITAAGAAAFAEGECFLLLHPLIRRERGNRDRWIDRMGEEEVREEKREREVCRKRAEHKLDTCAYIRTPNYCELLKLRNVGNYVTSFL